MAEARAGGGARIMSADHPSTGDHSSLVIPAGGLNLEKKAVVALFFIRAIIHRPRARSLRAAT